jgi:hypothetical protein
MLAALGCDASEKDPAFRDAGAPSDGAVSRGDATALVPDCGLEEGLGAEWVFPSGRRGAMCQPLSGGLALVSQDCRIRTTAAQAWIPSSTGPTTLYLEGNGNLFASVGPARTAFLLDEMGTECGPNEAMICRYLRRDLSCEIDIRRPGRVGDLVELVLRHPCTLTHDDGVLPVTEVLLTAAVIRGRLRYAGDVASAGHHDGGTIQCDGGL